jgi:hypothetical protein
MKSSILLLALFCFLVGFAAASVLPRRAAVAMTRDVGVPHKIVKREVELEVRRKERKVIVSRVIVWKMFPSEAVVVEGLGEAGALLRGMEVDEAVAEAGAERDVDVLQGDNSWVANWNSCAEID